MAQIKLYDDELDDLPETCAVCGEPATRRVTKSFSWHPPWVAVLLLIALLPYVIVALILTKRMTVDVPVCDRHSNHWSIRNILIFGSILVLGVLGIAGMVMMDDGTNRTNPVGGVMCAGSGIGLLLWLIMTIILQLTAIRPQEITDDSITLASVSPRFAEEVRDRRKASEEEDDRRPRRPRPRREEPPSTGFRE